MVSYIVSFRHRVKAEKINLAALIHTSVGNGKKFVRKNIVALLVKIRILRKDLKMDTLPTIQEIKSSTVEHFYLDHYMTRPNGLINTSGLYS